MMNYLIKYEPDQRPAWQIYKAVGGEEAYLCAFDKREQAVYWVREKLGLPKEHDVQGRMDEVNKAARDSFPASDPPAWASFTPGTASE